MKRKEETAMVKGVTESGFKFSIESEKIKDMAFVELAAAVRKDGTMLPDLLNYALGEEQKEKLYKHVRENNSGRVPIDVVDAEVKEILASINKDPETKN